MCGLGCACVSVCECARVCCSMFVCVEISVLFVCMYYVLPDVW